MFTFECCLKGSIILWAALYMKYQGAMLQLFGTLVTACIEKEENSKVTAQNRPKKILKWILLPKSLYCRKIKLGKMIIMLCCFPHEKIARYTIYIFLEFQV